MSPSVSVIIPIYNVEKYLRECLDSVCGQTLREIEIICVNDGSPDRSLDILKEYAARDGRIVIIDKKNEGVGAARNDGIRAAGGEYVAFMDPDDKYPDEGTLELLYRAAKENGVPVAGGFFGAMNENGERVPKSRSYYDVDFSREGLVEYKDFQCDYQFQAYVYDREFLIRNRLLFPTYARFQDPPFFVRTMTAAERFFAVNRMTYIYRLAAGKPKFGYQKAYDLLCGLSDNLELSKEKGLATLHYLSAMRLLNDASYLTQTLMDDEDFDKLLWKYIKTAGLIDEGLIAGAGHALPEPILPGLFAGMIEDGRQLRALLKHPGIRMVRKLFIKPKG